MILALALLLCGTERWAAKVLSDPAASQLNLGTKPTTIAAINALPQGCGKSGPERSGIELQLYSLQGTVRVVKHEKDGDLHIVLDDAQGNSIVVESPNSTCSAPSRFRTVIRAARLKAEKLQPGQIVTVLGPAFRDFFHGQTGMSRSCVEIHPIMWLR